MGDVPNTSIGSTITEVSPDSAAVKPERYVRIRANFGFRLGCGQLGSRGDPDHSFRLGPSPVKELCPNSPRSRHNLIPGHCGVYQDRFKLSAAKVRYMSDLDLFVATDPIVRRFSRSAGGSTLPGPGKTWSTHTRAFD